MVFETDKRHHWNHPKKRAHWTYSMCQEKKERDYCAFEEEGVSEKIMWN